MAAEIRMFKGDFPAEPAATGMVWTEIQPGSGRWVELPETFVTVDQPDPESWEGIMKQAQAARANMPLWVWPGIPMAIAGFKLFRWIFRQKKSKTKASA